MENINNNILPQPPDFNIKIDLSQPSIEKKKPVLEFTNFKGSIVQLPLYPKPLESAQGILSMVYKVKQLFAEQYAPVYVKTMDVNSKEEGEECFYVNIDELSKEIGVPATKIRELIQIDKRAINKLTEANAELRNILTLNKVQNFITKDPLTGSKLTTAFNQLKLKIKPDILIRIINGDTFDIFFHDKMQKTLIHLGATIEKLKEGESKYVPKDVEFSTLNEKKTTRYSYMIKDNEIYIPYLPIGKGSFKRAFKALELTSLQKWARHAIYDVGSMKAKQILNAEMEALEKVDGIPHTTPPYKTTMEVKKSWDVTKMIAIQTLMAGNGTQFRIDTPAISILLVATHAAEALAGMHQIALIHSDVKPDNILFRGNIRTGKDVEGFLHDFGILTRPGKHRGGTRFFLSPEITKATLKQDSKLKDKSTTQKIDSFSFGISLMQMLTGNYVPELKDIHGFTGKTVYSDFNQVELNQLFNDQRILISKNELLKDRDKEIKLAMLNIAQELCLVDVESRKTCKWAFGKLSTLLKAEEEFNSSKSPETNTSESELK